MIVSVLCEIVLGTIRLEDLSKDRPFFYFFCPIFLVFKIFLKKSSKIKLFTFLNSLGKRFMYCSYLLWLFFFSRVFQFNELRQELVFNWCRYLYTRIHLGLSLLEKIIWSQSRQRRGMYCGDVIKYKGFFSNFNRRFSKTGIFISLWYTQWDHFMYIIN